MSRQGSGPALRLESAPGRAPVRADCIVPAAGRSRRMGRAKQLLDAGGEPLVRCVVRRLLGSGRRCLVVTGARASEVAAALVGLDGVQLVHNPDYRHGMLGSILSGVPYVRTPWFLVAPADMPQLPPELPSRLEALAAELSGETGSEPAAVFPVFRGRRGHPVLIRTRVAAELTTAAGTADSMRELLAGQPVRELPVDDPGILLDIDTPEDYRRFTSGG